MNSSTLTTFAVHMLIASGALLLTGFVLHGLLRHRSAARRELVWRTAFVVLLLLPLTWFLRPWGMIRPEPAHAVTPAVLDAVDVKQHAPAGAATSLAAPVAGRSATAIDLTPIFISIWIAGAVVLLARLCTSTAIRSRWLAGARECPGTRAAAIWKRMSGTAGARLLVSPACPVPLTWGRVVILPEDALTWSDGQLEASLQHEAAHMVRRDLFFRRTGEVAVALFWPQPLVWLARRLWHRTQEQACDDAVIARGSDPTPYAELLCRVARAWTTPSSGAVAMAQPSSLEKRIRAVMNPACDRRPCTRNAVRAAVLLGLAGFTTAALAQKQAASPEKAAPPPAAPSSAEAKASKIIVPQVVLNEANLSEAITFLSHKAKELDPDKKGITITGPATPSAPTVTLDLRNASLWHVLTLVAEVTGTRLEAGHNGIVFKEGAQPGNEFRGGSAIEVKARQIILDRVMFQDATVDEIVTYMRIKCREADTAEPDVAKKGLNITTMDAGAGTYSLDLRKVSAWDLLNTIAKLAGMHAARIQRTNDGVESIILDRSVLSGEALGISDAVAGSPQFRALEQLKIAGVNTNGTLKDAAEALSRDIATASGGRMKVNIKVAPSIVNERYQMEFPANRAHLRLTSLTGLGKYEVVLDGDGFQVRPKSPK